MARVLARYLLGCVLLLAFSLQQTGMSRADGECCADEGESDGAAIGCAESEEAGHCAPACVDCLGCAGPARVLLSAMFLPAAPEPVGMTMEPRAAALGSGRDARLRLERPPRVSTSIDLS